jgi:hypothetical protein
MSGVGVSSSLFDQFEYGGGDVFDSSVSAPPRLTSAYLCLKAFLTASNLIFLIFAVVIIAVAGYALSSSVNALTGVTLPAGLICLGVFILVLSLVGALSVWKESRLGLAFYLVSLLAIVLSLFAVSVAVYVRRGDAEQYIRQGWSLAPRDVQMALEVQFACCGLTAPPPVNDTTTCPSPSLVTIPQGQTCLPLFIAAFQSNLSRAGGCGIAFSVVMGAIMILVGLLIQGITNKRLQEGERRQREGALEQLQADGGGGGGVDTGLEGLAASEGNSEDDDDDEEEEEEDEDEDERDEQVEGEEEMVSPRLPPGPVTVSVYGSSAAVGLSSPPGRRSGDIEMGIR